VSGEKGVPGENQQGVGKGGTRHSERLSREDWISAAWKMLGEYGFEGVRVEPLARSLGVTKGSFYWHFRDRQELIEALLDRWFLGWDIQLSEQLLSVADPAERIWALFESVIGRGIGGQTVALRLLSHANVDIERRIEKRDHQRLSFLKDQLQAIGFSSSEARIRGQIYQLLMTGEYLRSGGRSLEKRVEQARNYHRLLCTL
tara:strand:- start:82 stop:687 length:606 start_codon:yes stop_codon:yes gene_type:complete